MSTKLFINAFSSLYNQNRGGSTVLGGGGGSHSLFDTFLEKVPYIE